MIKNTYHVSLVRTLEYSDCIEVEAETEDDAVEAAMELFKEQEGQCDEIGTEVVGIENLGPGWNRNAAAEK